MMTWMARVQMVADSVVSLREDDMENQELSRGT